MVVPTVLILGESSVGKSSFLQKYFDPSFQPAPSDESHYWESQYPAFEKEDVKINVEGKQVRLNFKEVAGSRGRMGNTWEIISEAKNAQGIIYCFTNNDWTLDSLDSTLNLVKRGLGQPTAPQSRRKSLLKKASPKAPSGFPPVILVNCQSDKGEHPRAEAVAKEKGYPLISVSALNNTNIQEAFELVARTIAGIEEEAKVKEEAKAKEEAAASAEKKEQGILHKILAKFSFAEKKKQEGVEKVQLNTEASPTSNPASTTDAAPVA